MSEGHSTGAEAPEHFKKVAQLEID